MGDNQSRFRELADAAPAMLWITEPDGLASFLSQGWLDYTGQTQSEALGVGWLQAVHPEDRDASGRVFHEANQQRQPFTLDYRLRRADGEYRWAIDAGRPRFSSEGAFEGFVGSVIDVHERKLGEHALREAQTQLQSELDDTRLLQALSAELIQEEHVEALYERILDAAVAIMRSDFASMQMLYPHRGDPAGRGELRLLAFRGFNPQAAKFWEWVQADSDSTCGVALRTGRRAVAPDVDACDYMAATEDLATYRQTGIRSVQTTPLVSRDGTLVGMISTHWKRPHAPSERDLRLLDIVARQAADLIERKQSENAIRDSEARYRTLFNSMDEGYSIIEVLFDPGPSEKAIDYRFLEVNPAFEAQSGLRDVIGKRMLELAPTIEDHWLVNYGNVALTGQPVRFTNEYKALGRWFEVYAFRVEPDDGRRVAVLFTDVTATKAASQQLRDSEEKFRNLADHMPQLAWMADSEGWIFWYNQRWFEYTGTTLEQMQGWGWKAVHHPDHVHRVVEKFTPCVRDGLSWEDTFPLRGKDGQYRWFLSRMHPIRDDAGKVVRFFGSNTDVTEQRAAEEALRDANRRKDEFLATLAHELRNPLAPLRNSVEIIKRSDGDGDLIRQARDTIDRQLTHMTRLIDDLLDVSRISRGKIELRSVRCELASIVHQAVEAARPNCDAHGHRLVIDLPPQPVYLHGDPVRVAQVMQNLLNNACKFTEPGGEISLTVSSQEDQVAITVADTGIGIAADQLSGIFELFAQVDSSLERSQSGLGIGLTLVKKLVELHGGSIEARSGGVECGSEFTVRLPALAETAQPVRDRPARDRLMATNPRRVLVVDDNHDSANSLAKLLKLTGHEVHTAHDGLEAVETAATFQPDVILLDIGLPKLNGYEAASQIRKQRGKNGLTLVALTGWGQEEDRRRSDEAGFDAHMVKPVDYAELTKLLAESGTDRINPEGGAVADPPRPSAAGI